MKHLFIPLLILVFGLYQANAQNNLKDTIEIEEVVVTATKTQVSRKLAPLSISSVTQADIENCGKFNVLPVLNYVAPGVFVTERGLLGFGVSTGGSGSISIRGISGTPNTDVLILIDGQPQYQGIFGHPLPDAYVSSDIQKVEIIRGPASVLYGSNAMAGVINIITKKQDRDGINSNIDISYGSYNTQKYMGTLGLKKNKLSGYVSVNHDQTDGYRPNTDFKITNGFGKLGYEFNKHLNLTADYSIAKFIANDNGPIDEPEPFGIDILRGKASASLDNKFDKTEGSLKFYHNYGTHDLTDGWHSTDHNTGIMLYQSYHISDKSLLTAGIDYKNFGGEGNSGMAADTLLTVNEFGIYSYFRQKLGNKVSLNAGIRLENNSKYGNEFIPFFGTAFAVNNNTTLKGIISKGFRSPTIRELYLFAPNSDLEPERLMNYEVSLLKTYHRCNFEITGFIADASNIIQTEGQYPNVTRVNSGSFTNKGIEFSSRYNITKNLSLLANYNYLFLEEPLLAAPRQQANLSVYYRYRIFDLYCSAQHIDKLYTSVDENTTQSYTLVNVKLSAQILKYMQVYIMGNNLLNQDYEINYGYPMSGAIVFAGLRLNIKNYE
jgi:iron complex outermembrane receptor protein